MVSDRASGSSSSWIQPPSSAFFVRTNDHNPSVAPGIQLMVTDVHAGTTSKVISPSGGGGAVVVVAVVVVVVVTGVSSSVVVTLSVWSSTPS